MSGIVNQDSYKLGYKKGLGTIDLGIITFSSNDSKMILQNAFNDYDFTLTKINSGNDFPEEEKPKPYIKPNIKNEEKPEDENDIFPNDNLDNKLNPFIDPLAEIREKMVNKAREYIGSDNWSPAKKRTSFDGKVEFKKGEPKCNLFIHEIIEQSGIHLGFPNDYGHIFKSKRPYVCIQWFNEEVPNFKCLGKGMEALIQAQPGDIITNGGHIGIISAQGKTISASSIENVIVENDWGWREGQRDKVKVFRYMPNSENTLLNRKTNREKVSEGDYEIKKRRKKKKK